MSSSFGTLFRVSTFGESHGKGVGCIVDSCRTCASCQEHQEQFCEAGMTGTYNGIAFDEATVPINGDKAKIWGLELSYQQALRFLPSPLDGFGVYSNYTYAKSRADLPFGGGRTELPGTSRTN